MAMEIKREHHINFWYVVMAFIAILFIQDLLVHRIAVLRKGYLLNPS